MKYEGALRGCSPQALASDARYPEGVRRFYERHGRKVIIADMQMTMVSLSFLWLAVVGVI